jgi:hypothetical protein
MGFTVSIWESCPPKEQLRVVLPLGRLKDDRPTGESANAWFTGHVAHMIHKGVHGPLQDC